MILIFKSETNEKKIELNVSPMPKISANSYKSILNAYKIIWKIFRLQPIKILIGIQLTMRVIGPFLLI